jgi:hypothetical protein
LPGRIALKDPGHLTQVFIQIRFECFEGERRMFIGE